MESQLHTGHHHVVQWLGLNFNIDTILVTYLVFVILFVIVYFATRNATIIPGPVQNCVEFVLEGLSNQFKPTLGKRANEVSSVLFTFFLFILISNEIGLIPNPHIIASPTADINTTLGLSLAAMVVVWVVGIKVNGIRFFKHFFQPFKLFVVINIVEEISKPITLAFRLFGNIMAGELLLELLYKLVPYGTPIIWIFLSLFIGVIQAFIFTLLSSSYIGMGLGEEH